MRESRKTAIRRILVCQGILRVLRSLILITISNRYFFRGVIEIMRFVSGHRKTSDLEFLEITLRQVYHESYI